MNKESNNKKTLFENFFSLSVLQGANMILPLITFPYLVRVLGIELFGLINFASAIVGFFAILVSFGFDLSATKDISINRDDKEKVSEIFSSVMIIKFGLFTLSLIILSMLVFFIDSFHNNSLLYYMTFGIVFGNMIFPSWFFQGIEKMKYITIITVIAKIFFTIFIFLLVRNQDDFIFVPLLYSLGAIISGIISLIIIFNLYKIKLYFPSKHIVLKQFKSSYFYFVSRIANNGSRYFATSIVGVYFGNSTLGYYTLVEKLFYAFSSIGGIVSQTIFPYMSRTKDLIFFKKILLISMIITLALVSFLMFFNEFLLELVFGIKNELASNVFLIFFSSLIFSIPNSIIGYPLLAAFGHPKYANLSLIYASFIYLAYILIVTIATQNIYYTSFSVVVYMFTALFIRLYYLKKTEILNCKNNRII